MMSLRAKIIALVLLFAATLGTHIAKSRLNALAPDRNRFLELLYVPRGPALKIIACGFDAPLADLLWVQGLLYYSENVRASQGQRDRQARYLYLHQIFDIITDLNPRFLHAYVAGGMFLLSTGEEAQLRLGIRLFQKGLAMCERALTTGEPVMPDERWRLHMYLGGAYETHLRALHVDANERLLAHEDRRLALQHFERAACLPNAPPALAAAYDGLAQQLLGGTRVEERYNARIEVWQNLLAEKQDNKEFREYAAGELLTLLRKRDRMVQTRQLEAALTQDAQRCRARLGRAPASLQEILSGQTPPPSPMDAPDAEPLPDRPGPDRWLLLPGGAVRSEKLARIEAVFTIEVLYDALFDYYHKHGRTFPHTLEALAADGILDRVPAHPLAAIGYGFTYDPQNGNLGISVPPEGRDAPPAAPVPLGAAPPSPVPPGHVRVAAVQFCSAFDHPEDNRQRLVPLVRQAAARGARIIVLPEACIPGYADLTHETYWTNSEADARHRHVRRVAEAEDGESVRTFGPLSRELGIYLTVPIIEKAGRRFYITALLLDPQGRVALRHRKQTLWDVAEGEWASEGGPEVEVLDTPYGRIGVMICRDMHSLPPLLSARHADIVLHCAAFYGPNFETFLRAEKFLHTIREGGFHLVLANWTVPEEPWWQGYGMSRIIDREGRLCARARHDIGEEIVSADLPLPKHGETP